MVAWVGLKHGDSGAPLQMVGSVHRSIQVIAAAWGVNGNLLIEGSNDGTNYATLHDQGGNALSLTTDQIVGVLEISAFIRPRVSAGNVSTDIAVTLLVSRP